MLRRQVSNRVAAETVSNMIKAKLRAPLGLTEAFNEENASPTATAYKNRNSGTKYEAGAVYEAMEKKPEYSQILKIAAERLLATGVAVIPLSWYRQWLVKVDELATLSGRGLSLVLCAFGADRYMAKRNQELVHLEGAKTRRTSCHVADGTIPNNIPDPLPPELSGSQTLVGVNSSQEEISSTIDVLEEAIEI